jgi:hypothetical protein
MAVFPIMFAGAAGACSGYMAERATPTLNSRVQSGLREIQYIIDLLIHTERA